MLVDRYHYVVHWSPVDNIYMAYCREFPALYADGVSLEAALSGIRSVVGLALEDLRASGEPVPHPKVV